MEQAAGGVARTTVTAATGALGPVLAKLKDLLAGNECTPDVLAARCRGDVEFIISELETVQSLLLRIWEREDLEAACVDWMAEARKLSYDMEDDIDGFVLGLESEHGDDESSRNLFARLKLQAQGMASRRRYFAALGQTTISSSDNPSEQPLTIAGPRSRFLGKDASSELVEIEEKKSKLIQLLQEHEMVCIHGFAGMGKTTLADMVYQAIGEQFHCCAFVSLSPRSNMLQILTAILSQVTTDDDHVLSGANDAQAADMQRFVTESALLGETDIAKEQHLTNSVSNFLVNKRYLIIIDNVWHWEQLQVIRKSLPKNNLGSRIITSTHTAAIAKKCVTDNDAFVYEIERLSMNGAAALSERILKDCYKIDTTVPSDMYSKHIPCSSIAKLSGGMPLAVVCMSKSLEFAEKLTPAEGQERDQSDSGACEGRFGVAEMEALEGWINIPCFKQLVDSFCHGYNDLPLHLKTCLLHCSVYPPNHILEADDLARMWIAEGFVYQDQEEEALSYANELASRGFIRPCSAVLAPAVRYQMDPLMLHFLRSKSQEDYYCIPYLDSTRSSDDMSSSLSVRRIRRLSIQGHRNELGACASTSHLSLLDTRSLYVFEHTRRWRAAFNFKHLEHLQVLHLHGNFLSNSDLVDICWLLCRLTCLSLKGAPINLLPKQIGRLQRLRTLNVSNTGILHIPIEIGQLHQLQSLDISNTMVERLPEEIGKLKQLKSLYARNSRIRELPRKIRQLECLERLYVGNTLMAELPEEIGELQKLKIVEVRDMQAEGGSVPTVTLATGALGPVLAKLEALLLRQMGLGDDNFPNLDEGSQSDIESIISELKPLQAFLLRVWEREEDMDVACKEWMADARKLSYDMEDDIDGFLLGFGVQHQHGSRTITTSPFERIKLRVRGLFYRYCVEWNDHVDRITTSMASRSKSKAALGDLDPRSRFLHKDALELMEMDEKKAEVIELLQEHELVCILGFAGMGKTTLVDQVYQAKGEEFQCRAFVSVSPSPNMKQILSTILSEVMAYKTREVTDDRSPFPGPRTSTDQENIIDSISEFLIDKRYLIIVDDVWHWEQWQVIRKSLPKNNLGSRIITTTRVDALAKKYITNNDAFVYEMAGLSMDAAAALSEVVFKGSCKVDKVTSDKHNPCVSIAKMSGGMPLAVICMSLAVAEQLTTTEEGQEHDPDATCERFHVAETRALEGLVNIPCLKPLLDSLCLGYNELPPHLKTCLLQCSVYPPCHILERDDLARMWIAEGFTYEEEEARSYADELVNRGFIQRCSSAALKYEMNTLMLHFLRCKSQEDYCVTSSNRRADTSSLHGRRIRRLSIQSCKNKADISTLQVPDTHSLHVFDHAWRAPFKFFECLRVLDLHCNRLKNADLVDICGLLLLRCLSLKGSLINLLPKEIGRLRRLWILNMSNTGILRLLPEIGELQELKILDISNTMVEELPEEIGKLKRLKTLYVRNSRVREFPTQIRELQCLERLYARNTGIICVPSEIRELQHLETLDVSDTNVAEVPIEIGALQHLKTLNISNTKITKLPIEIGDVGDLETLDISNTRITELPREIGKLQHLTSLNICNTEIRELPWEAGNRVNLVRVLTGESDAPKAVRLLEGVSQACYEDLGTTPILSIALFDRFGSSWEPLHFARFKVSSRHMSVPQCFKGYLRDISSLEISLWKIQEDDLKILQEMPNLQVLALRVEALHRNIISFSRAGFQRLQSLCIDCRVPRVTFQRGALPELRYLNFKFYVFRPTERNASIEDPVGITHLQRLQRIVLRSASWYKSDTPGIKMIIDKVRKEAKKHSNRITICINEMKEVFPANKVGADACQEESCSASAE